MHPHWLIPFIQSVTWDRYFDDMLFWLDERAERHRTNGLLGEDEWLTKDLTNFLAGQTTLRVSTGATDWRF